VDFVWPVSRSPTGGWIAYTRNDGTTKVVALVRPDGTDQKDISGTGGSDEAAAGAWSPNGEYLLVQRDIDGHRNPWIMDLQGTCMGQVTHAPSNYGTYSWAPASGS